jgi:hypothetical protein
MNMTAFVSRYIILIFFSTVLFIATSCSGKQESGVRHDTDTGALLQTSSGPSSMESDSAKVTIYLRDGSTIIGYLLLDSIALRTQYATINLHPKLISAIAVPSNNNPTTISLTSGERLSGTLKLASFPVRSILGTLSVPATDISRVVVLEAGTDLDSGLVAFYPFSGDAKDKSGHGYDGTVQGAELCNDRFGNPKSAYSFDGNDLYISIPDGIVRYDIPEFSISTWLLLPDLRKERIAIYLGATTGEFMLQISQGRVTFSVNLAGTWNNVRAEGSPDMWTHVVAVYRRGKSCEIWVNGELRGESPIPATDLNHSSQTHHSSIGSYAPAHFNHTHAYGIGSWLGAIDEVRIYNRALGGGEIKALFSSDK